MYVVVLDKAKTVPYLHFAKSLSEPRRRLHPPVACRSVPPSAFLRLHVHQKRNRSGQIAIAQSFERVDRSTRRHQERPSSLQTRRQKLKDKQSRNRTRDAGLEGRKREDKTLKVATRSRSSKRHSRFLQQTACTFRISGPCTFNLRPLDMVIAVDWRLAPLLLLITGRRSSLDLSHRVLYVLQSNIKSLHSKELSSLHLWRI